MFSTKLLFTVLVVLYYCTTVSTDQYYVVATDCQPADGECHPLSFYVAHSSSYFTDNTIFYFKEGTHTVMDQICVTGVQNVSFIGSNQYVIINSTFPYGNPLYIYGKPLYIYNCINISIVNITILCEKCDIHDYYNIQIEHSHDIAIFNVNTSSVYVYNSFDITVYNSYIANFNGDFISSVHCYDTLQFHNLQVINSTLGYITLDIRHGTSYVLNVTLDNIILIMKPDLYPYNSIYLYSNSFYSVNIINTSCYGFIHVIFLDYNYNTSCQYPNTSIPIDSNLVITNSYFYVLNIKFISSTLKSNNQMISINSCSVHNGLYIENFYYPTFTMVSILIANTQLSFGTFIKKIDNIIFSNVSISNCTNTGLILINSKLTIDGSLTVSNNRGFNGGGMYLYGNSHLEIYPNSNLTFIGNHAASKGGGIYRESRAIETVCDIISIPNTTNVSFYFINNTAAAGDDIYGVEFTYPYCSINMNIFKTNIKYLTPPNNFCFCTNNSIGNSNWACPQTMTRLYKFPGQKIYFNVTFNRNITAGSIIRYLNDRYIDTIQIGPKCTEVSYTATVNSSAVNYTLNIYLLILYHTKKLTVPFSILPCPIGFTHTHGICTCSSSITAENVTCHIDTLQISHKGQLWIGPYNTSITFSADQPNHHNICLINEQCLFCNPSNVSFMLNDTDPQCQQHKSGTLCGSCTTGYSLCRAITIVSTIDHNGESIFNNQRTKKN